MKKTLILCLFFLQMYASFAQTFAVGHHAENPGYRDNSRNRDVWTEVYYPANVAGDDVAVANGQFPVVVFGHGFVMTWDSYSFLWNYLVPKGYICVFSRTEGSFSPSHTNFGQDLAFLSDYFPNVLNSDASSAFYQHILPKTAIMGHSMGGGSSFLACKSNTQVTTMITFAAANTNPASIDSATKVTIPTLVLAGAEDCVAPTADHQLPMYTNTASNLKYFVELVGASHCKFSDGNSTTCNFGEGTSCIGWGPFLSVLDQQTRVMNLTEPWLNYYLKGNCNEWTTFTNNLASLAASGFVNQQAHVGTNIVPSVNLSQNGNVLTANGNGTSFQWNLNNAPIAGASGNTYTPTTSGVYTVTTFGSNNCAVTSSALNFVMTGINASDFAGEVSIAPNPGSDNLHLKIENTSVNLLKMKVINMLGECVFQQSFVPQNEQLEANIKASDWAKGIYILEIQSEKGRFVTKWIKE